MMSSWLSVYQRGYTLLNGQLSQFVKKMTQCTFRSDKVKQDHLPLRILQRMRKLVMILILSEQ